MVTAIIVVVAVLGFGLFFFVVKRLLRLALRLAIVGAVLFAVLAGAVAWWWYAPGEAPAQNRNRNAAGARPARSPR